MSQPLRRTDTEGSTAWNREESDYVDFDSDGNETITKLNPRKDVSYRHMEGWNTPNYHKRRKRGELIPMTPWLQDIYVGEADGSMNFIDSRNGSGAYCNRWVNGKAIIDYDLEIAPYLEEDVSYLVQDAAAAIYSSGYDVLTFIAEFRQMVDMFRGLTKKFGNLAESYNRTKNKRRSKWSRAQRAARDVSNEWMESRYGWRVLAYDILNFIEVVNEFDDKRKRYSKRKGFSNTITASSSETVEIGTGTFEINSIVDTIVSYRGSVVADIQPPKWRFNLATTGWEKIPLSFVIDWFVSVGSAIDATNFLIYSTKHTGAVGINVRVNKTTSVENYIPAEHFSGSYNATSWATREVTVRTPTSVSILPHIRADLGVFQVMDLVALAIQRFRR